MGGINAVEAPGCGCMFTFCHAYLKMGVLLHKMAIVCKQRAMIDCTMIFQIFNSLDNHTSVRCQSCQSNKFVHHCIEMDIPSILNNVNMVMKFFWSVIDKIVDSKVTYLCTVCILGWPL